MYYTKNPPLMWQKDRSTDAHDESGQINLYLLAKYVVKSRTRGHFECRKQS